MQQAACCAPGLLGAALALCLSAVLSPAAQLPVRTFGTADGLPGDAVTALLEDSRGFLWVGTQTGLARFDGTTFVVYTTDDGLPHPGITALAEDNAGALWVGTTGGLARMLPARESGGRLFEALTFEGLCSGPSIGAWQANLVADMLRRRDGTLWIASGPCIFRQERAGPQVTFTPVDIAGAFPPGAQLDVAGMAEGADGSLWVSTGAGIARICPDARVERLPLAARGLLVDAAGDLWSIGRSLHRYTPSSCNEEVPAGAGDVVVGPRTPVPPSTPGRLVTWGEQAGMAPHWGQSLAQGRGGTIWAATTSGLYEVSGGRLRRYDTADGLASESLVSVLVDSAGTLWVGAAPGGLMRVAPPGLASFGRRDGLLTDKVSQILPDGHGSVLLVGFPPAAGVHRVEGDRLVGTRFSLPAGIRELGWAEAQAVLVDHRGEWWVPTGDALLRFARPERIEDLGRMRPVATYGRTELGSQAAFRTFEDSRGDVWMGLLELGRLARWERRTGTIRRFGTADGVPEEPASAFAEDGHGAVWIGFYGGGVVRWRDGRFRRFGADEGIPPGFVSALLVDRRGWLWAGSLRTGLVRIDDPGAERPRVVRYGRREGLGSEVVTCLAEDADGRIWIGTRNGTDLLDPATGAVRHYDVASGLISNTTVAIGVDGGGGVWIATNSGVSRLQPRPEGPRARLGLRLVELRVGGRERPLPEAGVTELRDARLPAGAGDIEIGFVGISLAAGGTVGFQHRLGRQEWSALAAERRLHLAGLSPGRYQLAVRAVRSDGATSDTASVEIVVPTPLWRRWWVVTADALLVLGGVTLAWRARRRRRRDLERVRSRIASDLHDELGLSLSRIAVLSEVARRKADAGLDAGGAEMREVGDEARDLIDATSDMAWALDPRSDDLPSLLARLRRMMADVFDGTGVAWSFAGPDTTGALALGAEQRRHLYLILKEAVHNAARHARANRVEVRVALDHGIVRAEVRDDGVGFDPGGTDAESGHGMTSMRRRAEELGGTLEVITGQGTGTLVRVVAPLGGAA
jgi:signal transduction histidine kinase/ligand-binding sensor domain-containing protein